MRSQTVFAVLFVALLVTPGASAFQDFDDKPAGYCGTKLDPRTPKILVGPSDCNGGQTVLDPTYEARLGRVRVIPVVFHVVMDSERNGYLPPRVIHRQIELLNEAFSERPGESFETGIRFKLAWIDPERVGTTGITYTVNDQWFNATNYNPMKQALHWDTDEYFNVYSLNLNTSQAGYILLGKAQFPFQNGPFSPNPDLDGVVLKYQIVSDDASNPYPLPFALNGYVREGDVLAHETGHHLALLHTFEGGGCYPTGSNEYQSGDRIADTPAHDDPSGLGDCVTDIGTCNKEIEPVENFMNYRPEDCAFQFTEEQINRMHCSLLNYRARLYAEQSQISAAFGMVPFQPNNVDTYTITSDPGLISIELEISSVSGGPVVILPMTFSNKIEIRLIDASGTVLADSHHHSASTTTLNFDASTFIASQTYTIEIAYGSASTYNQGYAMSVAYMP